MVMDQQQLELSIIGRPVSEVETPALVIDADLLERNLRRMADFFRDKPARLRPHTKTHKSPIIARMQLDLGAIGFTCAKVGEAEVMVNAGLSSILIANQVVGTGKALRLARLATRAEVMTAVDAPVHVTELSEAATVAGATIGLVIEVDVGMSRSGTRSVSESIRLAQAIEKAPHLQLKGLMGYEGHAVFKTERAERARLAEAANSILVEHADALRGKGFSTEIISAGGTGTYDLAGVHPGITEIQAGSYATMDGRYQGVVPEFENALTLLTSVVSRPSPERAVLDCGLKSVTPEFGMPLVRDVPDAVVLGLSEEHAKVTLGPGAHPLAIGDKLHLIPAHGCTTINLHDYYYISRKGIVEAVWPVAARGLVR